MIRYRPRFSLRTLNIAVALIGGPLTLLAALIYRAFGHWHVVIVALSAVALLIAGGVAGPLASVYLIRYLSRRRIVDVAVAIALGFVISSFCFWAAGATLFGIYPE
jgi:hypothetical protein